jgi:hypothetical protein
MLLPAPAACWRQNALDYVMKKEVPHYHGYTVYIESVTPALAKLTCSNYWGAAKKHKQQMHQNWP